MTSTVAPEGTENMVEASQLGIQQLDQLLKQLDEEIQFFTGSCQTIKQIQQRFIESHDCLKALIKSEKNQQILVPLTSAMYVPGKLSNVETVLIELGTGYYVDMRIPKAVSYFDRKVAYVTKQLEKLQSLAHEKLKMKAAVSQILEAKISTELAAQQNPAAAAAAAGGLSGERFKI